MQQNYNCIGLQRPSLIFFSWHVAAASSSTARHSSPGYCIWPEKTVEPTTKWYLRSLRYAKDWAALQLYNELFYSHNRRSTQRDTNLEARYRSCGCWVPENRAGPCTYTPLFLPHARTLLWEQNIWCWTKKQKKKTVWMGQEMCVCIVKKVVAFLCTFCKTFGKDLFLFRIDGRPLH